MLPSQKNALRICLSLLTAIIVAVVGSNLLVLFQSGDTYDQASQVPRNKVGLVLGCVRYLNGGYENPFFQNRIDAAARLFEAGKIDYLLVSGDNHRQGYDEASDMKQALVERGVPPEKIVCDYAGFSTLDSIVRSKEVFGQQAITVISQRFHNERAIYIAKACGVEAAGYNAKDVKLKWAAKTYLREIASRVKAVWDVRIVRRQPRFLGNPIVIGATA
jgi:SanA protein